MQRYVNVKTATRRCMAMVAIMVLGSSSGFGQYAAAGSKLANFFAQELQSHGVPVVNQTSAQTQPLARVNPRADTTQTNLAYWLDTMPQAYKNFREYVLIRKYGALIPIINPSAEDRAAIDRGEVVPTDHYLARGAFRHFGKKPNQSNGNFVLAAHSSDELSSAGSFKTAFMPLLLLGPGDTIEYYTRNGDNYVRYEYSIFKAEVTDPSNSSIMEQPSNKARLTAYSCRPLGSTKQRRYIQAGLIKTEKGVLQVVESPTVDDGSTQQLEQAHESAPIKEENTTIQEATTIEAKQQEATPTEEKEDSQVIGVRDQPIDGAVHNNGRRLASVDKSANAGATIVEVSNDSKEVMGEAPSIVSIKQQSQKNSYRTNISMIVQENTATPMKWWGVLGLYLKIAKTIIATIGDFCHCWF